MTARRLLGVALLTAAVAGVGGSMPVAAGPRPPFAGTAYTVSAEAYPVQPAFGSHNEPLGAKWLASRAEVSNPPIAADARAAAADLGMIEGFTGPVGPSAGSSTVTQGDAGRRQTTWHGVQLTAFADRAPLATASATGQRYAGPTLSAAQVRSTATADGSGSRLVATAATWVADGACGPLRFSAARFAGTASTDGRPGGARVVGSLTVTGAAVGGVPVVLSPDGVQVDRTRVSSAAAEGLTAAVHRSLARYGYTDIRLVQPATSRAADGTAASVAGGGIEFLASSNNATNDYFVDVTVLGGSAEVALGAPLGGPLAVVSGLAAARPSGVTPPPVVPPPAGRPAAGRPVDDTGPAVAGSAQLAAASDATTRLPAVWAGWPWLLAAAGAMGLAVAVAAAPPAAALRRRLATGAGALADRYLRG